MIRTSSEILQDLDIRLRSHRAGNTKCLCPRCSHTRKKKREPCLSVLIDDEGIQYFCHNCSWSGGEYFTGKARESHHPHLRQDTRAAARRTKGLYQ